MPRYIAFLRAINVGGHNVKMDQLRRLFEELGFERVETFIASGNVLFDSPQSGAQVLEKQIEGHLRQSLGYDVLTFLRSTSELAAIAAYKPFDDTEMNAEGHTLYVAFLAKPPTTERHEKLMSARNEVDDFRIHGREIYWLCRKKMSESLFSGPLLEKTIGMPATVRNSTTVRKLAGKYPAG